ncbi:MAG: SCP2 sterol-binding domain-containing protein [Pseudonocardiaceae bacterium]
MVASTMTVDWERIQDALRDEVRRVTSLLRSVRDPEAAAVGQWSLAEVAMHLSQAWLVVPGLARRDLSRIYEVMPGLAGVAGDSLIRDMWDLDSVTTLGVRSDLERDPVVLADRIEARAEEFFGECAGRSADQRRPWMVEGATVSLSALTGHLLNETVVHGYDIARAEGRAWRIEPSHAAMVLAGFVIPVIQALDPRALVDGGKAAGVRATYDLRIRGGHQFHFVFDDGALRVEEPSSRRVDCHISADPVAFLMVVWGRQNQWKAIAKGQLLAWGRKPWLGPRLRAFMRNP